MNENGRAYAHQLCTDTLSIMQNAKRMADSAGRWGLMDLFGGDFISTMVKHGRIRDVQKEVERARPLIEQLGKMLNRVDFDVPLAEEWGTGGFAMMADLFLDGFFADFYVQDRIDDMRDRIAETIGRLSALEKLLR